MTRDHHDGTSTEPSGDDGGDDAYERALWRRRRRFQRYLRVRGWVGQVLMLLSLGPLALSVLILGHVLGGWSVSWLERWTQGFDAVLAVFLPSTLTLLLARTGWVFWRRRKPEDDDTGCLVA